jgi:hypothetical protein
MWNVNHALQLAALLHLFPAVMAVHFILPVEEPRATNA